MIDASLYRLRPYWKRLPPWLRFRPVAGPLWYDVVLILIVGALNQTVLPSLLHGFLPVDLMTPWLVTTLVLASLPRGLFITVLGALILETHSVAPAGLYLCAYWMIAAAVHLTRGTLSWRHALPWLLTFVFSQLWIIAFEAFVLSVTVGDLASLDWTSLALASLRLIIGVGIGLLLAQRSVASGLEPEES